MNPVRVIVLVIAAVAAIGLAFVMRGVLAGEKGAVAPTATAAVPMAKVLVAKRELTVGTRLGIADMDWQDWPASALNATLITNGVAPAPEAKGAAGLAKKAAGAAESAIGGASAMEAFEGAVVKEAIAAREPITASKVVRGGEGGYLSVVLNPGMRAVAVSVDVETGAGGFILPGDRVDVLESRPLNDVNVTRTILRNIRVLAIDQAAKPAKDANTLVGAVATLEVSGGDAEVLAGAQMQEQGGLILALRSFADAAGPTGAAPAAKVAGVGGSASVRVHRGGAPPAEVKLPL